MVEFKELRVTSDGKRLIIDAAVKDLSYYDRVFIDSVVIDTQDTFTANGPSTKPVYVHEVKSENSVVYALPQANGCGPVRDQSDNEVCMVEPEDAGEKRVRLELTETNLGVSLCDTLFFVYVVTKGTPSSDTPCGMDNQTTLGIVANLLPFYRKAVDYMKEVENDCDVPKGFLDWLLRFKAFELSVRTGHYTQAIKYWNRFFRNLRGGIIKSGCGCHG